MTGVSGPWSSFRSRPFDAAKASDRTYYALLEPIQAIKPGIRAAKGPFVHSEECTG